jgi:hypothetical protein
MSAEHKGGEHAADGWLGRRKARRFADVVMRFGFAGIVGGAGFIAAGIALSAAWPIAVGAWAISAGIPTGLIGWGGRILTGKHRPEH